MSSTPTSVLEFEARFGVSASVGQQPTLRQWIADMEKDMGARHEIHG